MCVLLTELKSVINTDRFVVITDLLSVQNTEKYGNNTIIIRKINKSITCVFHICFVI